MKRQRSTLPALCFVALVVGALPFGRATLRAAEAEGQKDTQKGGTGVEELDRLQQRIQDLVREAGVQRRSQQQRLREVEAEKRATSRTVSALETELARREKVRSDKQAEIAELEKRAEAAKQRNTALKGILRDHLAGLEKVIENGIEWLRQDRLTTLRDARQTIDLETTPPAAALAIVSRLQKEEEAIGRLVETRTLELEVAGDAVGVQGFHLGLLAVIFASEKGDLLGYAAQGQSLEDGLATVKSVPGAADGYQKAVEILRRRRTPTLIDLHLLELPLRNEGVSR